MKAFGIRSEPVLESSIAGVDTFEAKQATATRTAFKSEPLGGDFGACFRGPSSIPEPALRCAMIFVACIYGLVLVGATRGIVWSCKKLFKTLAAQAPMK